MKKHNRTHLKAVTLLLAGYLMLTLMPSPVAPKAYAQEMSNTENTILTRGYGQITAEPDSVNVSLSVETQAPTMEEARQQNSQKMQRVMNAIRQLGIPNLRLETQAFNAYPIYEQVEPEMSKRPSGPPRIVAYRVSNNVNATVEKVNPDQLGAYSGRIIDQAIANGANNVSGLNFYLEDIEQAQARALEEAMQNARENAETLAQTAGVSIKGIYSIEGFPQTNVRPVPMMSMRAADMAEQAPTPVEPGEMTITSEVVVRFRF